MVVEINGFDLYDETFGDGEPLLWLHGFMGCGSDSKHIFKEPPSGYRLIAPDMRGHGASTNPSGAFSHRQCALDVRARLRHMDIERVKPLKAPAEHLAVVAEVPLARPRRSFLRLSCFESDGNISKAPGVQALENASMNRQTGGSEIASQRPQVTPQF